MTNNTEALHLKYRPQHLDDVIGQDATVENLKRLFEAQRIPHTFLLTGPSGCGKTTIARILAQMLECSIIQVDAARFSGADTIRDLLAGAQYAGLDNLGRKFYIIDECHSLSRTSWQTLLLSSEEPPAHLYWAFCTTEPDKVPNTIRTRSHTYDVKPVRWELLAEYLDWVRQEERLKVPKEFVDLVARAANGSPRQGLVFLSMLDGVADKTKALKLVEDYEAQTEGPIQLARLLVSGKGATWANTLKILETLTDVAPETIRLTVLNYTAVSLAKTTNEKDAARLLAILQQFSTPCNQSEKMAPVLLALGGLLLS